MAPPFLVRQGIHRVRRCGVAVLVAVLVVLCFAPGAHAASAGLSVTTPSEALAAVGGVLDGVARGAADLQAQAGARAAGTPAYRVSLSKDEATRIAKADPRLRGWTAEHRIRRTAAEFQKKEHRWKVSFVGGPSAKAEVVEAEVYLSDEDGSVAEIRVGPQVAWMMARGYEGAFGRAINRWRIWIPLCLVFLLVLLPLTRPRRILSMRTLDLLVLLSFTASWHWFNEGEIFTSVPLQYPPLVYLLGRMIWIAVQRTRRARTPIAMAPPGALAAVTPAPTGPRRPGLPGWMPTWLLVTVLVLLMALRWGLNAFDSNVIDVGYAGVIGADLILKGTTPYGTFPTDCGRCDTYGPLTYISYVPFEAVAPWTGKWDDLPAAHGAAVLFDALTLLAMIVMGWRIAGRRMGLTLGIAWAAFPFTAFMLSSNSNDALVSAAIAWGLVLAARPLGRGLMIGLGVTAKIIPGLLIPLWARHPFPRRGPAGGARRLGAYVVGLIGAAVLTGWVMFLDGFDGVRTFWSRTVGYQMDRESPFSIWGQYPGLKPLHLALGILVLGGALVVLRWPRRIDLVQWAALSAAIIIGFEITLTHWFYLYVPWFLPLVLLVVVPEWSPPTPKGPRVAAQGDPPPPESAVPA